MSARLVQHLGGPPVIVLRVFVGGQPGRSFELDVDYAGQVGAFLSGLAVEAEAG